MPINNGNVRRSAVGVAEGTFDANFNANVSPAVLGIFSGASGGRIGAGAGERGQGQAGRGQAGRQAGGRQAGGRQAGGRQAGRQGQAETKKPPAVNRGP